MGMESQAGRAGCVAEHSGNAFRLTDREAGHKPLDCTEAFLLERIVINTIPFQPDAISLDLTKFHDGMFYGTFPIQGG